MAVAGCVLVLEAGCGGGAAPAPVVATHVRERIVALPADGAGIDPLAADPDEAGGRSVELSFEVLDDEIAFLLHVRTEDAQAPLSLARLVSPSGTTLHAETGDYDDPLVDSRIANVGWASEGELALFLPNASGLEPVPGTWQVEIALPDGDAVGAASILAVRRTPAASGKRLDLAIMDATTAGLGGSFWNGGFSRADLAAQRAAMDEVLAGHGLAIGRLESVPRAPRRLRGSLSIDGDAEADMCRQAAGAARTSAAARDGWALPVVIVDGFHGDGDEAEDLIGWAPVPGVPRSLDSSAGCIFVAAHDFIADDAERNAAVAMTLLHEVGHFMGLEHVSEADGLMFDRLDDTRECRLEQADGRDHERFDVAGEIDGLIDDFECGVSGGANNLMFWSGVPEFAPFVLSGQQADVLARHPLFRPNGADRPGPVPLVQE